MVRIRRLNLRGLDLSEQHARRLTPKAKERVVRDVPPVTWTPADASADPLDYSRLYAAHVEGAFIPKGKGKALHLLVKLPQSVPVATTADAEAALRLVVAFGRSVFGEQAVFAGRMDRDETSLTNAELFIAPRYVKRTKHTAKDAVSLSRHLKLLAEKHGGLPQDKDILRRQGQVLQDAFAQFLRENGYQALRGQPKKTKVPDWTAPEAYGARTDRAIAEADREVAAEKYAEAEAEHTAAEQQRRSNAREREQLQQDRTFLADDRERLAQALDDADRARQQIVESANSQARGIIADADDEAGRLRGTAAEEVRKTLADAEAAARQRVQQAEVEAERMRRNAVEAANQIKTAARAAAQAEAAERTEALDQRQRAVAALEQDIVEISHAAQVAADRAQADAEIADTLRRGAEAANEEARQRRDAAEQTQRGATVAAAQIALAGRAMGDEALNPHPDDTVPSGLAMDETAMTSDERSAYRSPWSSLSRTVTRAIAAALEQLAELKRAAERMLNQAREERAAVDRDRAELRRAERKLLEDRFVLKRDRQELAKHQRLAAAFVEAYEAVPEAERTPQVAAALKNGGVLAQAAGLSPGRAVASKGPIKADETQSQPTRQHGEER